MNRRAIAGTIFLLAFTVLPVRAAAQVADWPIERPPRPLPARDVDFPPYQFRTLKNGLQVIAVSHHEQPVVSFRLIVRAGAAHDPEDKPGVASLAATLLDQGTATRSAAEIAEAIESAGGSMGTGSGSDLTFVQAVVLKDRFDLALNLVADVARNPRFAPEEIERQRQQILSGLTVSYNDPDYLASVVFDRLVYGFHPYGRPAAGTPQSIASITREDLLAFHKRWFGANNAILAIVGDISREDAFAAAEKAFGDWQQVERTTPDFTPPPPPTRRLVIVDRPGAVQTEIRAGNIALPRKHPDYLALDLAMKILGGEGGNRLHRVLRSERGLTYGAAADVNALKDAGDIVADTDTRSETTAEALRLVVDEIWRLQRQPVSVRELADAQAYLTGSFPLTIETPSAIALQVLNAVFYGLDLKELETYRDRVNAVSPEDIQRVAKQYLRPDRLSIVLVGDASAFAKELASVGFGEFEQIPLAELDLTMPDLRRRSAAGDGRAAPAAAAGHDDNPAAPASSNAGQPADEDRRAAKALIDRAVRAKGGLEKLKSVETVKAEARMTIQTPGGTVEVPTTTWIRYPDAFRVDAQMPAGPVSQVYAGGEFWVRDQRGVREAPAAIASEMQASVQRDSIRLLLSLATSARDVARTAVEVDGAPMPALEVRDPARGPLTVIFDPATFLIARQRYAVMGPDGTLDSEEIFSDYRDVDGLKVAFRAAIHRAGAPSIERVVESFAYNVPVDPALFSKEL